MWDHRARFLGETVSLTQTHLSVITRMANWLLMIFTNIMLESTNYLVCLSSHSLYLYMYL